MGCCSSGSSQDDEARQRLLADVRMDEDETEEKADQPLANKPKKTDDELPEMSVNRLAAASVAQAGGRRGNAAKPSPLNSFPQQQKNQSAFVTPTTTSSQRNGVNNDGGDSLVKHILPEEDEVIIEDKGIIDDKGDVHVNRYYNETRNANLSITSKVSDLSSKPVNPNGVGAKSSIGSNTTQTTNLTSNQSDGSAVARKSNASALLWDDDFSDKQTVASDNNNNTANV